MLLLHSYYEVLRRHVLILTLIWTIVGLPERIKKAIRAKIKLENDKAILLSQMFCNNNSARISYFVNYFRIIFYVIRISSKVTKSSKNFVYRNSHIEAPNKPL